MIDALLRSRTVALITTMSTRRLKLLDLKNDLKDLSGIAIVHFEAQFFLVCLYFYIISTSIDQNFSF